MRVDYLAGCRSKGRTGDTCSPIFISLRLHVRRWPLGTGRSIFRTLRDQIKAARAKAAGQPWPPGDAAVIAFKRIAGKPPIPSFPPDARFMIPSAPPPPPPPPVFKR